MQAVYSEYVGGRWVGGCVCNVLGIGERASGGRKDECNGEMDGNGGASDERRNDGICSGSIAWIILLYKQSESYFVFFSFLLKKKEEY